MKILGIDLGTTNSALATASDDAAAAPHGIQQVVGPGEIAERATLPSFLLLPSEHEVSPAQLQLPWSGPMRYAVGTFARERGAELPHRLVSSAKSWLCNPAIDRTAQVLPFRGAQRELEEAMAGGERVSPVNASARYLAHLRAAWDDAHPDEPADEQEVLVTVPASFDPVARELTVVAAREAGFEKITLLEEPQAAFYAYLASRGDAWRKDLKTGDVVLVCDIGGGTTDFSLIEVRDEAGSLALERIAVGDHILLGGDNMDLGLAALAGRSIARSPDGALSPDGARSPDSEKSLDALQQRALVHACRAAKETLLGDKPPKAISVSILGRGSKLIGGTVKATIEREAAEALLVDGFFPKVAADAKAERRRAGGLRELGLPYAHDPAVTRHLAEFLAREGRMPTAVLFNGGVMKAAKLQARVVELLRTWAGRDVRVLEGADLDLAVALGAAHYGQVRRGKGIRIRGGTARAYYIGIESAMPAIPGFAPPVKALCVAPQGLEEGSTVELPDDELGLVVGEMSTFRFFAAATRETDTAGSLVEADATGISELDPVEKLVEAEGDRKPGQLVPVRLESHVTEVGTLELWCVARDGHGRWKLEYSVRERD